jgi:hypothetical protein
MEVQPVVNEKLLYSRHSAAAITDLSVRAIDYAIRSGQLEACRIGRRVMITREALLRFVQTSHQRIRPAMEC